MPVSFLAVLVGSGGMLLGFVMLTRFVVVSRLIVMMGGRIVPGGRLVMMFRRGVFALVSHIRSPGKILGEGDVPHREGNLRLLPRPSSCKWHAAFLVATPGRREGAMSPRLD